jgi:hypothetical protein
MEELKLIIQLLSTLGEQGKEAFIWWLFMDKALPFIAIVFALTCVVFIARNFIHNYKLAAMIQEIAGKMNIYTSYESDDAIYLRITQWIKHHE